MKAMERLGVLIWAFAWTAGLIYGFWGDWREPVGVVCLFLGGLLGLMISFYLWRTRIKLPVDPSDDPRGEIDQLEGEYGFFSPHSWQPLFLALAAAICFLGLAVGWWLFIIGAFVGVPALIGWTYEYWRGPHAL